MEADNINKVILIYILLQLDYPNQVMKTNDINIVISKYWKYWKLYDMKSYISKYWKLYDIKMIGVNKILK